MNIFLFFYLWILFILLTPGILLNLSVMKSTNYSNLMVAAIHGFLFSAIVITTYSFVNDFYLSSVQENMGSEQLLPTGLVSTYNTPGQKEFNTLSTTPPGKTQNSVADRPNIKCGSHKFCGSADPDNQYVYCYGESNTCKWNQNDCNNDNDCQKYTKSSAKYTDAAKCPNYNNNGWPVEFCKYQGLPVIP
jgi:hypothetical protein